MTMSFEQALHSLRNGGRVARKGWNGRNMWLVHVPAGATQVPQKFSGGFDTAEWIGMRTADKKFVPWLASQTDILAVDWEHVATDYATS